MQKWVLKNIVTLNADNQHNEQTTSELTILVELVRQKEMCKLFSINFMIVYSIAIAYIPNGVGPVSYTHLDVYKRQIKI